MEIWKTNNLFCLEALKTPPLYFIIKTNKNSIKNCKAFFINRARKIFFGLQVIFSVSVRYVLKIELIEILYKLQMAIANYGKSNWCFNKMVENQ